MTPSLPFDIESLVDHARRLWRDAQGATTTARVELFVRVALRSRVARNVTRSGVSHDHTYESGTAVRLLPPGSARAGFAAASGVSSEVVRWTLETARGLGERVAAMAPRPSEVVESERWDLDAIAALPSEEDLSAVVMSRDDLEWLEAGTTLEVLVGEGGWLAARRRNRVWALMGNDGATLRAQRGFARWEQLAEPEDAGFHSGGGTRSHDLDVVVLAPDAASSLVVALAGAFHGIDSEPVGSVGRGWVVSDAPTHLGGLTGGSFDDAGFPAVTRELAGGGAWKAALRGPGTMRRGSFREPPKETATNLVMPAAQGESAFAGAPHATRCHVHRLSSEVWVMELDIVTDGAPGGVERRWITIRPQVLLAACVGRLGGAKVTSQGPIVPSLVLEGLPSARE